jgi:GT2 family glycosyltransferase
VISVLIVNYRKPELLLECLDSLAVAATSLSVAAEVILVDNGSHDRSVEHVRSRHPTVKVIALDENEGFAPAVRRGADTAAGDWLILVNNDARVDQDTLRLLYEAGESDPRIGSVTAQVRFADRPGIVNTAGLEVDHLGIAFDRFAGKSINDVAVRQPGEVFGVSGCVAAYRMSMLRQIGGFDGSFFAYLEDADVAWRARVAGWTAWYEPRAVAYHHGSATLGDGSARKYTLVGRNRMRLIAKNATSGQLWRWAWAMLLYDSAYVAFIGLSERTLAPARGRFDGLREWRTYRRAGAEYRGPVTFSEAHGWLGALRMRAAYRVSD